MKLPRHLSAFALAALLMSLTAAVGFAQEGALLANADVPTVSTPKPLKENLMYTTYFYTATEAIVHGYEADTSVRIVSLAERRTVWQGKVGPGETKLVPTGGGVFGFLSDKKASLLVGTPSSCTVVGYWLRDEEGAFVADHFYGRIPQSGSADDRVLVWAWEDVELQIADATTDKPLAKKKLKAGEFHELAGPELAQLGAHVLDIRADKPKIAVQVYFDEGFFVPSVDGRTAGKIFRTYVGATTEGVNDLNLISYHAPAKFTVKDLKSGEMIWKGTVEGGGIKTLTLTSKYVEVRSDIETSVLVAPYEHYKGGYAEHHYGAGVEGTGIETNFLLTTPDELWIFSYFDNNPVEVVDAKTNKTVWKGTLNAGHVHGVNPGYGYYRVKASAGVSVMGGDQACGAEYTPAGGLFRVDEELLKVTTMIIQERREQAAKDGRTLSAEEEAAPLSDEENDRARRYIKKNLGKSMAPAEVQQRIDSMVTY